LERHGEREDDGGAAGRHEELFVVPGRPPARP
jgi:hypothetical protein